MRGFHHQRLDRGIKTAVSSQDQSVFLLNQSCQTGLHLCSNINVKYMQSTIAMEFMHALRAYSELKNATVVQMRDNTIHRINIYPMDKC